MDTMYFTLSINPLHADNVFWSCFPAKNRKW